MKDITEKEAIRLLKKYCSDNNSFKKILAHSKIVKKVALNIGKKIKGVDLNFIKCASLLHDIGRFQCITKQEDIVKHGIIGSAILRKEGLPKYALAAERHLGAGISREEILEQGLNLPLKNYIPKSKEEKIIAHADNIVFDQRIGTVEESVKRFSKELGKKVGLKIKKLAEDVEGMREIKT